MHFEKVRRLSNKDLECFNHKVSKLFSKHGHGGLCLQSNYFIILEFSNVEILFMVGDEFQYTLLVMLQNMCTTQKPIGWQTKII